MAKRKVNRKRKTTRRRRRNTASVGQSTALAPYRASSPARRSNPRRRRRSRRSNPVARRRNGAITRRRSNPFGGQFFGINLMDVIGGVAGVATDQVAMVLAAQLGVSGLMAYGARGIVILALAHYVVPKNVKGGFTIGGIASLGKSVADQYLGLGQLQAKIVSFIPVGAGAAAGSGAGAGAGY